MTGKLYYLTSLGAWKRLAERFVHSHWIVTEAEKAIDDASRIFVVVDADEGAHAALEDDPDFEKLPHPLSDRPLSDASRHALAPLGIRHGDSTFVAAEALARIHPLLRHRVF
jgi:hypothetical protein